MTKKTDEEDELSKCTEIVETFVSNFVKVYESKGFVIGNSIFGCVVLCVLNNISKEGKEGLIKQINEAIHDKMEGEYDFLVKDFISKVLLFKDPNKIISIICSVVVNVYISLKTEIRKPFKKVLIEFLQNISDSHFEDWNDAQSAVDEAVKISSAKCEVRFNDK